MSYANFARVTICRQNACPSKYAAATAAAAALQLPPDPQVKLLLLRLPLSLSLSLSLSSLSLSLSLMHRVARSFPSSSTQKITSTMRKPFQNLPSAVLGVGYHSSALCFQRLS